MSIENLLKLFPEKRIHPADGLAVTAQVWEEAHAYHRQQQRFHDVAYHGWGIVTGLEVIASDPPDTSVYILPGVAVDPVGQIILLPQPVAYDIGDEMDGLIYLLLNYEQGRPRADDGQGQKDGPLYVHAEFSIAARTSLPNTPWVELARVNRRRRQDLFVDAPNPIRPGHNQIDLRFRHEIGAPAEVSLAVCYLGEKSATQYGLGASYLAQALNHSGRYRVAVHDDAPLGPGIESNTLIYLVGQERFELNSSQMNGLFNYVRRGQGTLFIESHDSDAESAFMNFLRTMDMTPEALKPEHRLLVYPHLFAGPPPGFEDKADSEVLVSDGVIFSTCKYGLLWQGQQRDGRPARETIRAAVEWGGNVLTYAKNRHRRR